MPKEYIEREAALNLLKEPCKRCYHRVACEAWVRNGTTLYDDFNYSVEDCPYFQPAADVVEVVHAKWLPYIEDVEIYNAGGFTERRQTGWVCGKCKDKSSVMSYGRKYCPNCGAKMEGYDEYEID